MLTVTVLRGHLSYLATVLSPKVIFNDNGPLLSGLLSNAASGHFFPFPTLINTSKNTCIIRSIRNEILKFLGFHNFVHERIVGDTYHLNKTLTGTAHVPVQCNVFPHIWLAAVLYGALYYVVTCRMRPPSVLPLSDRITQFILYYLTTYIQILIIIIIYCKIWSHHA